jgi:diguanylate cyclase (GGDEF)-like protein
MGSFKLKLVFYFLLLALVPLAAAFWGFSAIAARSETRQADARLQSSLRSALAIYGEELDSVGVSAERLASRPGFARALVRRDRTKLQQMLGGSTTLRITGGGIELGVTPPLAAERPVSVIGSGTELGKVIGSLPLDRRLVRRLEQRAGLDPVDHLVLADGDRVIAGPGGRLALGGGRTATVDLGGERYRALASAPLEGARSVTLAVVTPQARIDAAGAKAIRRVLFALAGLLIFIGVLAYLEGRSILSTVQRLVGAANAIASGDLARRVPVRGRDELATLARSFNEMAEQLTARLTELNSERERLQEAISLFGEALAATHDIDLLLRVVLDAQVEATGAAGGMVIVDGRVAAEIGALDGAERIEVPLHGTDTSFGLLVLVGPTFAEEDRLNAVTLAAHAVVALENARLHRVVEHQALVDGLTGLANRRHAQETLETELARAERFGGGVALVFCDLDAFKDVNDRHGHLAGDDVLRELALVLRDTVRAVDLAARWGGEEFALLLPGTDASGAAQLAERARAALEERTILSQEGEPIHVTASFGVAASPEHGHGAEELLRAADRALYEAKRRGKNRVEMAPETLRRP